MGEKFALWNFFSDDDRRKTTLGRNYGILIDDIQPDIFTV